jgi:soluble lytic murein transglycosylase
LLATVAFALGASLAALGQTTVPAAPTSPRTLSATEHAPLPRDLSEYWFVPPSARVRPRPDETRFVQGVRALVAGDFSKGLALVEDSNLDEAVLSDYVTFYRAIALQEASRLAEADAALTSLVEGKPQGYLSEAAALKQAEVALARGNAQRAERILRALSVSRLGEPEDTLLALGETEEAADHRDHALEAYRRVYYGFPASGQAVDAKAALDRLQAVGNVPPVSFDEALSRAERLFSARRWTDARAAFEPLIAAVSGDKAGDNKELAAIRVAECDYRLGNHRAARDRLKPFLDGGPREAEARYFYLNAVRGLGDRAAYVALTRTLVTDHPASEWAAEALNDLASRYLVDDRDDDADRVFRELLLRFPRHRYSERAAWKVGWAAYRSQRFAEAATVFESAAATFPRADYRPSWLYWSGRARAETGDKQGAWSRYQLVVADYGSSYYGRLASKLRGSMPAAQARARAVTVGSTVAAPPSVHVIRALIAASLLDDALREVQYAQRTWGDSPQLQATFAWIRNQQSRDLRADERFTALRGAITTMRRAYPQFLSAEGDTLPVEVLGIIFPLDYWDLIQKYSSAHRLDPYLIAALMAQESTFTAEIRSSANARGLLQVMPSTGRVYARKLGIRPFSTGSLSQPETNVRIGTRYFKDLLDRFGAPHYALAAYNAGETRVTQWLKEAPGLPADEFIDNIPFPETQNYVKRILGTVEDYRRLYAKGRLTAAAGSANPAPN